MVIRRKDELVVELKGFAGQNKEQLSMVEVAYQILVETNNVFEFNDLLAEIQDFLNMPQDELESKMATFYTEMNYDGSFISLGDNRWGLREWYAVDSIDEEIVSSIDDDDIKAKHKGSKSLLASVEDDDLIDYASDDPEDVDYVEDEEDYDDEEEDEEDEISAYSSDLGELGDDEEEEDLEDGLEGDLSLVDEDDDEEDEEDF